MDTNILYPTTPAFAAPNAALPGAGVLKSGTPPVPSAATPAVPKAASAGAPPPVASVTLPASGIDYSKYAGMSPYDVQMSFQQSGGMPPNWSWDEWMKANPGAADPRTTTNAGQNITAQQLAQWNNVGGHVDPASGFSNGPGGYMFTGAPPATIPAGAHAPIAAQKPGAIPSTLKSGAPGTTGTSTQPTGVPGTSGPPAAGQPAYGAYGNLSAYTGQTKPDTSKLPPWLADQLQGTVSVDEGGTQTTTYNWNENPWGGYRGEDGKYYVQVGDPSSWKPGDQDGGIIDPSKVTYDPNLGYVTTADNLHDSGIGGIDWRMVAAVVGAGLAGTAAGLGAEGMSSAGAVAGTDAAESGGTLALNAAGNGVAPYSPALGADAVTGAINNALQPGTGSDAGLPSAANASSAGSGLPGATGTGVDVVDHSTVAGATGSGPLGTTGSGILGSGITLGDAARGAVGVAGIVAANNVAHPPGATGTNGSTGTSADNVNANKPIADDARNSLLNHGAPTQDQRHAIDMAIEQQRRQGHEAILQASINSGQGNSDSMVVQDKIRAFDMQVETMRQQAYMQQAEQNTLTALSELGLIDGEQLALAQIELGQNTASQNRATSIMQGLGWLWAMMK